MEKRKKKRIIPYCVMIGILSIGVVLDIYVNVSDNYKIGVSESYMDYIYAGIISVSVLCFSFVALLSGFLDRMYYGYKLREILQFKEHSCNSEVMPIE